MEVLGYLVLAGVIGFVGWRFYLKVIKRPAGTGEPIRPPRGGDGKNKQR